MKAEGRKIRVFKHLWTCEPYVHAWTLWLIVLLTVDWSYESRVPDTRLRPLRGKMYQLYRSRVPTPVRKHGSSPRLQSDIVGLVYDTIEVYWSCVPGTRLQSPTFAIYFTITLILWLVFKNTLFLKKIHI